jgi:ankyrin repeat protein
VRLLLDAGAGTTGRNHNKMTPYGLAVKRNHKKAAKELLKG